MSRVLSLLVTAAAYVNAWPMPPVLIAAVRWMVLLLFAAALLVIRIYGKLPR